MSDALHKMEDRDLLKLLAAFQSGFQTPEIVLEGLTEEQVTAKPHGLPHSIADLVGHMWYWQDYFNRIATDGYTSFPEHAEEGWPKLEPGGWPALRERYLATVKQSQELAATSPRLHEKLLPPEFPMPAWERETAGSGLVHSVIHSSHHLGQVITLRQLLQLWPPAAGSMTW